MANIGVNLDNLNDDRYVIAVQAAVDTLDDGNIVIAASLLANERTVYVAGKPAAVDDDELAVIMGANVYEDAAGNRIDISDPTQITYPPLKTVRALRLPKAQHVKIDKNAVEVASQADFVVGKFLSPTIASYKWTAAATIALNATIALKIEALEFTEVGLQGVETAICRVVVGY